MTRANELAKRIADDLIANGIDAKYRDTLEQRIRAKLECYITFEKPAGNIPQISSWSC